MPSLPRLQPYFKPLLALGAFGSFCFLTALISSQFFSKPATKTAPMSLLPPVFRYNAIGLSPPPPLRDQRPETSAQFALEIGVYHNQEHAKAKVKELKALGLNAYFTPLQSQGRVVFRVRYGLIKHEKEAKATAHSLHKQFAISSQVIRL